MAGTRQKPIRNTTELLKRLNRLSTEADWTVDELRTALQEEGISPDEAVSKVKIAIAPYLTPVPQPLSTGTVLTISSLVGRAKELGIKNARSLAATTALSLRLIAKLERRLLDNIPELIIRDLARVLKSPRESVLRYLQLDPKLAEGANYKSDKTPGVAKKQDFYVAVREDPELTEERQQQLLSL
jgi:hypothetical protein